MSTSHPKIAHVITESEPFGGAQRNTLLSVRGLAADGYPTDLVCGPGGRLIPEARAAGVRVHVVEDLVRQIDPRRDVRAFVALYRLFRSERYDIVHTHSTKAGLMGRLAAHWARVPWIVHTLHSVPFEMKGGLRDRLYIALERLVGRHTHRMACVSEVLREEAAAWSVVPSDRLSTIYSGIDFAAYQPNPGDAAAKRRLGLESAWPIVGSIGRLSEQKAQHVLVEAVARLREKYPKIQLLLVGEGPRRPFLEERIRELGIAAHASLTGEQKNVTELLNVFDVYATSSLWEGLGRALTEAMYWGLPIVATPVNGVREVIRHEDTGLLVPTRDPQALADAIDRLLDGPALAQRVGAAARRTAVSLMDGRQMVLAIERLYAELAGGRERDAAPVAAAFGAHQV
jgi:glycosyltransferase involved in cell wall biosynthesis